MLTEAPYIVQEEYKPISSKDTEQHQDSPFIVPPFTPPPTPKPIYVWWSWHPNYPYWSRSCWKAGTIEEAQLFLTDKGTGLKVYHNKLIKHDGNSYTEVLDVPCQDMEVWRNIKRQREKSGETM